MALISSKLMCLEPILRISCKAMLRFSAAPTAGTIPRLKLESSTFHTNGKIKSDLVSASMFSTDSKKQKKKKQDDQSTSKHMKLPFEKRKESYIQINRMNSFLRGSEKMATITQKPGNPWP